MRTLLRILAMTVLVGAVAAPTASRAGGVIVGNLGQPPDTSDPAFQILANFPTLGSPGVTAAQQFTTGSSPTSIDRIFASLGDFDAGTNGTFALFAQLFSDDSSHKIPGVLLATFSYKAGSIPTSGFANVEFDTSPISLSAATNYWLVLGATYNNPKAGNDFGSVTWQYTLSTTTYGPGSLPGTNQSSDGTKWSAGDFQPNEPFLIQAGGVPEPSSLVLGSIAILTVFAASRWVRPRHRTL